MSIKKQVWQVIGQRIAEAQEACDAEVANLRAEKKSAITRVLEGVFTEIARIRASFRNRKAEVEARYVNSILAKVL